MSTFFKQFPKINYSLQNDGIQNSFVDIFRYVDVVNSASSDILAYDYIDVIDGERPDVLSHRIYNTPDYYWTFFILNDFLKEGQSAWPKAQNELRIKLNNDFKNIAIHVISPTFRDETNPIVKDYNTPQGLDINKYIPYLHLAGSPGQYANAIDGVFYIVNVYPVLNILKWNAELNQIWTDTTTHKLYAAPIDLNERQSTVRSEYQSFSPYAFNNLYDYNDTTAFFRQNTALGAPSPLNQTSLNSLKTNFNTPDGYTIHFINPFTSSDANYTSVELLKRQWLKEVAQINSQNNINNIGQAAQEIAVKSATSGAPEFYLTFGANLILGDINNTQAKLAPAYYYSATNSSEIVPIDNYYVTEGNITTLSTTPNYVSYEQFEIDKNEEKRRIRYVKPSFIQDFANEYKRLINE